MSTGVDLAEDSTGDESDADQTEIAQAVSNSDDIDDYLKRSVHKLKMSVLQTLQEVDSEQHQRGLSESAAASYVHSSVKSYLLFIEQAIRSKSDEARRKYFRRELGEIAIQPPSVYYIPELDRDISLSEDNVSVIGGQSKYPDPQTLTVRGILSSKASGIGFTELPKTLSERFTVDVRLRHKGKKTAYGTASQHVPRRIAVEAFRLGNEFVTEEGLGLVDEDEPDAKFDYSDLSPPDEDEPNHPPEDES